MIIGLILLIIGVVFLLQNLGYISEGAWSITPHQSSLRSDGTGRASSKMKSVAGILAPYSNPEGICSTGVWPAILIVIGLGILLKRKDQGFFWEERIGWGKKEIKKEE